MNMNPAFIYSLTTIVNDMINSNALRLTAWNVGVALRHLGFTGTIKLLVSTGFSFYKYYLTIGGVFVGARLVRKFLHTRPPGVVGQTRPTPYEYLMQKCQRALPKINFEVLTRVFEEREFLPSHPVPTLDHPNLAANRSAFATFVKSLAFDLMLSPFDIARSNRSARQGIAGTRSFYWCKDLDKDFANDDLPSTPLIIIEDTDHKLQMDAYALPAPTIIFHQCLRLPAYTSDDGEYRYRFDQDGTLLTYLKGNSVPYSNLLWNYGDHFMCTEFTLSYPFIRTTVWKGTSRKTNNPDWHMTLLIPRVTYGPLGTLMILCHPNFETAPLQRVNPVNADGKLAIVVADTFQTYNIAAVSNSVFTSTQVTAEQLASLSTLAISNGPKAAAPALIQQRLKNPELMSSDLPAISHEYSHAIAPTAHEPLAKDPAKTKHYTFGPSVDLPASVVVDLCPAFVDNVFVPHKDRGNVVQAISNRATNIRTDTAPSERVLNRFTEFLEMFFSKYCHKLVPVSIEEVARRQAAPRQRRVLDAGLLLYDEPDENDNFIKSESYDTPNDPRLINTVGPQHKVKWSAYQYAVSDVLKKQLWYAFGTSQSDIAFRVANICANADVGVQCGDLSRMDGRINAFVRDLERRFYLYVFDPAYWKDVTIEHSNAWGRKCALKGVKYYQAWARASGDPETSNANSLVSAFIQFCACKNAGICPLDQQGNPRFIVGGDDSLCSDVDDRAFSAACDDVGQKPKPSFFHRDCFGVNFLARFYSPAVWSGDPTSMADPERALRSLAFSVNLPQITRVTKAKRLAEKCYARLLTDADTPIVGPLCRAILRSLQQEFKIGEIDLTNSCPADFSWFALNATEGGFFPNDGAHDWGYELIVMKCTSDLNDRTLHTIIKVIETRPFSEWNYQPFQLKVASDIPLNVSVNHGLRLEVPKPSIDFKDTKPKSQHFKDTPDGLKPRRKHESKAARAWREANLTPGKSVPRPDPRVSEPTRRKEQTGRSSQEKRPAPVKQDKHRPPDKAEKARPKRA